MFSEKYRYTREKQIQYESISDALRRRIWNLFYQWEILDGGLSSIRINLAVQGKQTIESKIADKLGFVISTPYKNNQLGNTQNQIGNVHNLIEKYIIYDSEWYNVYDFIEIHLSFLEDKKRKERIEQYNNLLEDEKSGYRVVNGTVAPITNKEEIEAIEQASNTEFLSVNEHLQKSLSLYADIKNPDYENSIKESISAVEAMCCIITGMSGAGATLGKALKKLKDNGVHIHSAMENAFSSLYGYTSDENGIRHGGIDFTSAPAEDAKYMLVSCSAFVNYLIEKWSKVSKDNLEFTRIP